MIYTRSLNAFRGLLLIAAAFCFGTAQAQTSSISSTSATSISGTASSTSPITRVDISIWKSGDYWQGSGFSSTYRRVAATLTTSGNNVNWTYNITPALSLGRYYISARAIDSNGRVQSPLATKALVVDYQKPTSTITNATSSIIQGTANDDFQLNRVEVSIRDTSGKFWDGSAFSLGYKRQGTSLTINGNWTYNISPNLTPGRYYVRAFAFDAAGKPQSGTTTRVINVGDSIPPTSTISSANGTSITGTSSDNVGVASVQVAIRNSNIQYWNGSALGGYARVQASLNANGNWTYNTGNLPPGSYVATAIAFDNAGNPQAAPYNHKSFVITAADNIKPVTQINTPAAGSTLSQPIVNIAGIASDNIGVTRVELAIRNANTAQFWNGSTWQSGYYRVTANGVNSGASSTNWDYVITVPRGTLLGITSFAFDAKGNFGSNSQNTGINLKVMALGDSITEGWNGEQSYRLPLTTDLNYEGCVYEMIGSRTINAPNDTGFVSPHEGYSGHPVEHFLNANNNNALATINAEKPDVVLLHLGSNDMRLDQSISGTVAEIDDLVGRIWNANPFAEVFVANVIPWYGAPNGPNTAITNDITALGNQIQSWIASQGNPRLHMVDVRSGFDQSYMAGDNIHPNATGDAHIADAFLSSMNNQGFCP